MIRYVVKYDGTEILYDSFDPDTYPITYGTCSIEVNAAGSMSLSVPVNNPALSDLKELTMPITLIVNAYKPSSSGKMILVDSYIPFHGRILNIEVDDYGNAVIECEGIFNVLNDIKVVGYDFMLYGNGDWGSVKKAMSGLIDTYNTARRGHFGVSFKDPPLINGDQYKLMVLPTDVKYTDDDTSINGVADLLMNTIVNKIGGFFYLEYQKAEDSDYYHTYISFERGASVPLDYTNDATDYMLIHKDEYENFVPSYDPIDPGEYPEYEPPVDDQDAQDLEDIDLSFVDCKSPEFLYGCNIISVTKSKSSEKIITGIIPAGSDFSLATEGPYSSSQPYSVPSKVADEFNATYSGEYTMNLHPYYIVDDNLASKYGVILESITWSDVKTNALDSGSPTRTELYNALNYLVYSNAIPWMKEHLKVVNDKYTIVGLEPIEYGRTEEIDTWNSKYLVRLMYGVRYQDDNKNIRLILPCLGIKYDLVNHANNEYTIGPLIPENYNETNISNS